MLILLPASQGRNPDNQSRRTENQYGGSDLFWAVLCVMSGALLMIAAHEVGQGQAVHHAGDGGLNVPPHLYGDAPVGPVAAAGIVRTKDLKKWERLDNLKTLNSPQQRNVVLHPEFVNGKYAFYTRPMDDFIDTGSGGGIGFGLCDDITHAVIDEEIITSKRKYHTITEAKNGAGAVPIKTPKGWIHIAHGVRNTAAGLRYVVYAFATSLEEPTKVIAEPGGFLIAPLGEERVGDVSNVVFTNGAIARDNGDVYIYYASSDTRLHVATTTIDKLMDYVFNTPTDPLRSVKCVEQRCDFIKKNLEYLNK